MATSESGLGKKFTQMIIIGQPPHLPVKALVSKSLYFSVELLHHLACEGLKPLNNVDLHKVKLSSHSNYYEINKVADELICCLLFFSLSGFQCHFHHWTWMTTNLQR